MNHYNAAIVVGGCSVFLYMIQLYLPFFQSDIGKYVLGIAAIIMRIIAPVWIFKMAKMQKRRPHFYMSLAVIVPSIMLMIVGLSGDKKLTDNKENGAC